MMASSKVAAASAASTMATATTVAAASLPRKKRKDSVTSFLSSSSTPSESNHHHHHHRPRRSCRKRSLSGSGEWLEQKDLLLKKHQQQRRHRTLSMDQKPVSSGGRATEHDETGTSAIKQAPPAATTSNNESSIPLKKRKASIDKFMLENSNKTTTATTRRQRKDSIAEYGASGRKQSMDSDLIGSDGAGSLLLGALPPLGSLSSLNSGGGGGGVDIPGHDSMLLTTSSLTIHTKKYRSLSFGGASTTSTNNSGAGAGGKGAVVSSSSALDHLDALASDSGSVSGSGKAAGKPKTKHPRVDHDDEHSDSGGTMASGNQRILFEALMGAAGDTVTAKQRRDRYESWGGMSDLSAFGANESATMAALPTFTFGDTSHSGGTLLEDALHHAATAGSVASSISDERKHRKNSVTSETSSTAFQQAEEREMHSQTLHEFVAAAMNTVGDQLAELAGAVENVLVGTMDIAGDDEVADREVTQGMIQKQEERTVDLITSTTKTAPGEDEEEAKVEGTLGHVNAATAATAHELLMTRPRAFSTGSGSLSVDFEAVAAAVDAAEAATGGIDLSNIAAMTAATGTVPSVKSSSSSSGIPKYAEIHADKNKQWSSHKTKSERDMEEIKARARAAAGYVPPSDLKQAASSSQPPKKRGRALPLPLRNPASATPSNKGGMTPQPSKSMYNTPKSMPLVRGGNKARHTTPMLYGSSSSAASPVFTNGNAKASNQKWDEMFACLQAFVLDKKRIATKGMSDKERKNWKWDGNVPTTYKTRDGKALGRWINNQRSAKNKGSLKRDREAKLVSTGLRWSVLSIVSWEDMMQELRIYVADKTKHGGDWDGNVPTNYRIKGAEGCENDDKNLGRWINRQRSLKQAGKLKKEREAELEEIGLKWSVLSTSSWEGMFETLLEYIAERKSADSKGEWDGNVPANYKTNDNPPKALGRWINRQRSTYIKGKLKREYVDKLGAVGLKWSVHERRGFLPSTPATGISIKPDAIRSAPTVMMVNKTNPSAKTGAPSPSLPSVSKSSGTKSPIIAPAAKNCVDRMKAPLLSKPILKGQNVTAITTTKTEVNKAEAKEQESIQKPIIKSDGKPNSKADIEKKNEAENETPTAKTGTVSITDVEEEKSKVAASFQEGSLNRQGSR